MSGLIHPKILCVCLFLLAAAAWPTPAAPSRAVADNPWNLAVVVEQSAAMEEPWLGPTRRLAAQKALGPELRSLPLRVTAGLWLSSAKGAQPLVKPSPARGLKSVNLDFPPGQGSPALTAGLAAAAQWLGSQGGGAILLVGSGAGPLPGEIGHLALDRENIFCHVLSLNSSDLRPELETLTLEGSGAFFPARKPAELSHLLREAVRTALSPARLLVLTHDYANKPLKITYGLTRANQVETRRRGFSGRPLQVLPAVYKISFPAISELGPGDPPRSISVGKSGVTRVWYGGKGVLKVAARGAGGEDLAWSMRVARRGEGKLMENRRQTPFRLELPADFYLVNSLSPALSWTVEVGAGRTVDLTAGPPGNLTVVLKGADKDLRVPLQARDLLGGEKTIPGYTGSPLKLLPGSYRLKIDLAPPVTRRVDIKPGAQQEMELPMVGELLVPARGPGLAASFEVYNLKGRLLAIGLGGRRLPLAAGTYQISFGASHPLQGISITAGRLTTVSPPTN